MATQDEFEASLARLSAAKETLSTAIDARLSREAILVDTEVVLQRMTADRGRLAKELDLALARSERLEKANREVSHRLVDAMERVRNIVSPPSSET
ncbi:DUF4164 family protein [Fulvimarina endophytica]|uniref:DUF4164 family protein n=1 Tax=Fulvimarina endophytica TaxID=2293836 RepID=A0A371X0T8_9HYPH|nr:DUF4164 family protein [Fulvimarina endophytica]RFC62826.1 DUF4164 family protein [Fulvimarina endophytica]